MLHRVWRNVRLWGAFLLIAFFVDQVALHLGGFGVFVLVVVQFIGYCAAYVESNAHDEAS